MLAEAVGVHVTHAVSGSTVAEILDGLFAKHPGLRGHIVQETGRSAPCGFVSSTPTGPGLDTAVPDHAAVYVLHAVSGG